MFEGVRSVIFPTADLAASTAFWSTVLGTAPYFEEPFYVGFHVGRDELGLDPDALVEGMPGPVAYWKVADVETARTALVAAGATQVTGIRDVGGGIRLTTVAVPEGHLVGLIEQPD